MNKFKLLSILWLSFVSSGAFASNKPCVVSIPQDCDILGTRYSATANDPNHVVEVDCKKADGSVTKYMVINTKLSGLLGLGRFFVPSKLTFERSGSTDGISIECAKN